MKETEYKAKTCSLLFFFQNCRITDWKTLRDQLNRNGTKKLNLKKIVFVKSEEDTWEAFAKDLVAASTSLETIELPKISTVSLHTIVQCAKDSPITRLSSFTGTLSKIFLLFFSTLIFFFFASFQLQTFLSMMTSLWIQYILGNWKNWWNSN